MVLVVEHDRRDRFELPLVEELGHDVLVLVALEEPQLHACALGDLRDHGQAAPHVRAPVLAEHEGLHAVFIDELLHRREVVVVGLVLVVVLLELVLALLDRVHPRGEIGQARSEALGRDNGGRAGHRVRCSSLGCPLGAPVSLAAARV